MSDYKNADWMSQLKSTSLIDLPLTQLAIPGSHNSGTFVLDSDSNVAPGGSKDLSFIINNPAISPLAKGIIHRWAVCQTLHFTNQLLSGIRYFDIRVATKSDSQELFCVHELYGPKIDDLTEAVNKFLTDYPQEVVLLDFNHFYGLELEHHILLVTHLQFVFGDKILLRCDVESITLSQMWKEAKQIIIFYDNIDMAMFPEVFLHDCIISPWPNTPNTRVCLQFLSQQFSHKHSCFSVCQGVLTPNAVTIMTNLLGSLEQWLKSWVTEFVAWIKAADCHTQSLNIIICDFVNSDNFIQTVLDLNLAKIK